MFVIYFLIIEIKWSLVFVKLTKLKFKFWLMSNNIVHIYPFCHPRLELAISPCLRGHQSRLLFGLLLSNFLVHNIDSAADQGGEGGVDIRSRFEFSTTSPSSPLPAHQIRESGSRSQCPHSRTNCSLCFAALFWFCRQVFFVSIPKIHSRQLTQTTHQPLRGTTGFGKVEADGAVA